MNKKTFCITGAVLIFLSFSAQPLQAADEKASQYNVFSLAVNPVKLLFGLINMDLEFQISSHISIHIFSEILLKETDHPDLVVSLGPRYYFSPDKPDAVGFYSGINLGYVWYKSGLGESSMTIGSELSYKYILNGNLFISPRSVVTYPISKGQFLLGFEFLMGKIL